MNDEKRLILDNLKQMADSIVITFGRNCEVAVHDLTNLKGSLVHIAGNVTRRDIGAPATDMLVRAIHEEGNRVRDRHNYKTTSKDGRVLKSSTIFTRDSSGVPVAAFCINLDTTDFLNAARALEPFINDSDNGSAKKETFASDVSETVEALFEQALSEIGKQPSTMTIDEKVALAGSLERKGTFQIKGAVDQVALMLGVTRYTVYNYLKKSRAARRINRI